MNRTLVVFVHGVASGPQAWDPLVSLLRTDPQLEDRFEFDTFEYSTRLIGNRVLARKPTYRTVGEKLRTRFLRYCAEYESIVFITHSQGGLVLQTFLSRVLARGEAASLARIRRILLIACPNEGSGIFLLPRRLVGTLWPNAQERRLRPLDEEIADVHQQIIRDIVQATEISARTCPIEIIAYAAEEDGIVLPPSAYGGFLHTGVLPGNHSTVIRPSSRDDQGYLDLRAELLRSAAINLPENFDLLDNRHSSTILPSVQPVNEKKSAEQDHQIEFGIKTNLPQPEHSYFVGREHELDSLIRKLLPSDRTWLVLIDGVGGVGKTALAVEVARRLLGMTDPSGRSLYDAAIWASAKRDILTADGIRPRHSDMSTLRDLYVALCTVLEHSEILRMPESEQRLAVRELLSGDRRILLVVDNLETLEDEHVTTFLRELPQPSKAIVTSRHRIDVAYSIRLEGLRTPEAMELVGQETSRRGIDLATGQAEELIRKTGGIPLAILWSLGLIGLGHSVNSVLERLGSGHNDITRFCFTESVSALKGSRAERLLAAAELLDEGFTRELLGLVAGFGVDELSRDDALQQLLVLSLINESKGLFNLLPLTRTFVADYLRKDSALAGAVQQSWLGAMRSLADGYRGMNAQWRDNSRLVVIGPHMKKAYEWCANVGNSNDALLFGYIHLLFLDAVGRWDNLLELAEQLAILARGVANPDWVVSLAWLRSWVYGQRGDIDSATQILDEAESLVATSVDRFQYLLSRSQLKRWLGDLDMASQLLDEGNQVAESLTGEQARMAKANVLFERGKLARDNDRWLQAKAWFEESAKYFDAESAAERLDAGSQPAYDIERALGILGNLGYIEHRLGNQRSAHELLSRAIVITRKHGPAGNLVTLLQQLAEVELDLGQVQAATTTLEEALELATKLRAAQELAECRKLESRLASLQLRKEADKGIDSR
jgi:tetratricopeptide (TPR) repeat protein